MAGAGCLDALDVLEGKTSQPDLSQSRAKPDVYDASDLWGCWCMMQVLAVAHVAGLKLERGYGCKAAFLGDAPFLEMKGRVLGGEVAVLKAIANVSHTLLLACHAQAFDTCVAERTETVSVLVQVLALSPYCSRVVGSCLCVCVCFRRAPRRCVRARPWWTTGWSGDTTRWRPSCIPRVRRRTGRAHTPYYPTTSRQNLAASHCLLTHV